MSEKQFNNKVNLAYSNDVKVNFDEEKRELNLNFLSNDKIISVIGHSLGKIYNYTFIILIGVFLLLNLINFNNYFFNKKR